MILSILTSIKNSNFLELCEVICLLGKIQEYLLFLTQTLEILKHFFHPSPILGGSYIKDAPGVAEIDLSTSVLEQKVSTYRWEGPLPCNYGSDGWGALQRCEWEEGSHLKDRNKLTFSDCLLCMHQANTAPGCLYSQ